MENNEILERLLEDDKLDTSSVKDEKVITKQQSGEVQISRIRIISAKYKVYIVLLAILICGLLLIYIPREGDALKTNRSSFTQANSQLDYLKRDIKDAENDMKYLCDDTEGIISNEDNVKNCLADDNRCYDLPESWKTWTGDDSHYDTSVPVSYLQVNSLYNEKMPVDEKKILKNLNKYLIKQDISWNDKRKVWNLLKINIGDPEPVEGWDTHFMKVSVDVEIEFDTVEELIGFLYNVEKKMIDNREDRILYKIQSVSYDVVSNDEPQITDISMAAYYYHDENIDNNAECDNNYDNPSDNQDGNDDNVPESEWFLQKIFKKFKK